MTYVMQQRHRVASLMLLLLTMTYTLNLYLPYSTYEGIGNPLKNVILENWIQQMTPILSTIHLIIFGSLWLFPARDDAKESVPESLWHRDSIEHGED